MKGKNTGGSWYVVVNLTRELEGHEVLNRVEDSCDRNEQLPTRQQRRG